MNESGYNQNRDALARRLKHLAAFSGLPHWSFSTDTESARPMPESAGNKRRNGVIAAVIDKSAEIVKRAWSAMTARRQLAVNLRELRNLNDHQLRDIGLHRGDIAAIVNGVESIEAVNEVRALLARPACKVIALPGKKVSQKTGESPYLVDHAA